MANTSRLKQYFKTGKYPTEAQFIELIDSFFNRDEKIPITSVAELIDYLNKKIDRSELNTVLAEMGEARALFDLSVYYTKSETYSKEEINAKIVGLPTYSHKFVSELPMENIQTDVIYMVDDDNNSLYTEYIRENDKWVKIGYQAINFSDYVAKTELKALVETIINIYRDRDYGTTYNFQ